MMPTTGLPDVAARLGMSPEMVSAVVVFVAPRLVSPLAAVWKRWRNTTGPDTRMVIKVLTALIVGVLGFALGLYGYDLRGVLNAIGAGILAYLKTTGDYDRDVAVQAKANRLPESAPTPVDDVTIAVPAAGPVDVPTGFQPLATMPELEPGTHADLLPGFVPDGSQIDYDLSR